MRGLQPDQKMNMVRDTADTLRKPIQAFDRATKVFVLTSLPLLRDRRLAMLRAEDEVVMQAQVGR